jgi:hypothetical protein
MPTEHPGIDQMQTAVIDFMENISRQHRITVA